MLSCIYADKLTKACISAQSSWITDNLVNQVGLQLTDSKDLWALSPAPNIVRVRMTNTSLDADLHV